MPGIPMSAHEDLQREHAVTRSSEKSFGVVMAAVFGIVGTYPWATGGPIRLWALGVAGVFLLLAFGFPRALAPFNRLWFGLGMLLNRLVSPIVLGAMFFLLFTPFGLVLRLVGTNLLNRRQDPTAKSYWVMRAPASSEGSSMRNQF